MVEAGWHEQCGERQLALSKNWRDAQAFGVRLRSETDSPLFPSRGVTSKSAGFKLDDATSLLVCIRSNSHPFGLDESV
jgi:hypothetical protein